LYKTDFSELTLHEFGIDGQTFSLGQYKDLKIGLLGKHQIYNAATSVNAVMHLRDKGFEISEAALRRGLLKAKWPGRFEVVSREPAVIIDGAHNAEGARMLRSTLDEYFPGRPVTFIMGVLSDKDYDLMMKTVLPGCKRLFAITINSPRALSAPDLAKNARKYCKNVQVSDTIEGALRTCIETASQDEVICAFGSLYYIGEVRSFFGL